MSENDVRNQKKDRMNRKEWTDLTEILDLFTDDFMNEVSELPLERRENL
ncbi:MAG: hypothetical protein SOI44_05610 [Lactimicrobium sp.]|jgi:hypothetical protein